MGRSTAQGATRLPGLMQSEVTISGLLDYSLSMVLAEHHNNSKIFSKPTLYGGKAIGGCLNLWPNAVSYSMMPRYCDRLLWYVLYYMYMDIYSRPDLCWLYTNMLTSF